MPGQVMPNAVRSCLDTELASGVHQQVYQEINQVYDTACDSCRPAEIRQQQCGVQVHTEAHLHRERAQSAAGWPA